MSTTIHNKQPEGTHRYSSQMSEFKDYIFRLFKKVIIIIEFHGHLFLFVISGSTFEKKLHNNHTHLQQNSFFLNVIHAYIGHTTMQMTFCLMNYNGGWVALDFLSKYALRRRLEIIISNSFKTVFFFFFFFVFNDGQIIIELTIKKTRTRFWNLI